MVTSKAMATRFGPQKWPLLEVPLYSHIYNKIDRKANRFSPSRLCQRLMYIDCFHYRITSQVQNKFHDRNSAIE